MAFKMKGPSTHRGTAKHTGELKDKYYQELKVNRELDKTNLPDGRSESSPFQHKAYGSPHPINPQGVEQQPGAGHPNTPEAHNVKVVKPKDRKSKVEVDKKTKTKTSPAKDTKYFGQNTSIGEVNAVTTHNQKHTNKAWDTDHKPIVKEKKDKRKKEVEKVESSPAKMHKREERGLKKTYVKPEKVGKGKYHYTKTPKMVGGKLSKKEERGFKGLDEEIGVWGKAKNKIKEMSSPAKCPLIAMAPMIMSAVGAMKKKKEE